MYRFRSPLGGLSAVSQRERDKYVAFTPASMGEEERRTD